MELTNKLKIANAIYESKIPTIEKVIALKTIKNLNEDELNVWVMSESWVKTTAGLAAGGAIAAAGINSIRKKLSPCISNCKDVLKLTGNKENYSKCIEKCNSK